MRDYDAILVGCVSNERQLQPWNEEEEETKKEERQTGRTREVSHIHCCVTVTTWSETWSPAGF